jgi:glutamyl-tRNA reductase
MIVGEAEIQGQVKRAHEAALAAGTTGPLTGELFSAALKTGRRVRSETAISAGHTSVSSVAVGLAEEVVGGLAGRKVLVVGAGETAELTARALSERGASSLVVTNRHTHRARVIANRFGGAVAPLQDLPEHLADADIVVSSTASPHTIIEAGELGPIAGRREGRPLVLVDLAVPRDIDPECARIGGVSVYDMDDLQRRAADTLRVREEEREAAGAIVDEELVRFSGRIGRREADPLIGELRRHAEQIAAHVLAENAGRWESASPRDLARVEALTRAIVQRLLHEPTIRLKALEQDGDPAGHQLAVIAELFGLSGEKGNPAADPPPANVLPLRRA